MIERKYTLDEIDRMRDVLWFLYRNPGGMTGQAVAQLQKMVERRLRTYLMAGIEPSELESKARQAGLPAAPAL